MVSCPVAQPLLLQHRSRSSLSNLLVLSLLQTHLGDSRRSECLLITVQVVQWSVLNLDNCFYMLLVKLLMCTDLFSTCCDLCLQFMSVYYCRCFESSFSQKYSWSFSSEGGSVEVSVVVHLSALFLGQQLVIQHSFLLLIVSSECLLCCLFFFFLHCRSPLECLLCSPRVGLVLLNSSSARPRAGKAGCEARQCCLTGPPLIADVLLVGALLVASQRFRWFYLLPDTKFLLSCTTRTSTPKDM